MSNLPPQLEIAITADGSPTIAYKRSDGYIEKMHHSGGALNESMYIYHHGLVTALDQGFKARIVSLGLGLGYNELIAVAEFARRSSASWKIWSFEADPYLREEFLQWATQQGGALAPIFEQIAELIAAQFKLDLSSFKNLVSAAIEDKRLDLRGSFPETAEDVNEVGIFFFDAFSNKMSPDLWQEQLLISTFKKILAPQVLLCTYAATGALNRVLKGLGFRLLDRPGFQGKRESTLAIRT